MSDQTELSEKQQEDELVSVLETAAAKLRKALKNATKKEHGPVLNRLTETHALLISAILALPEDPKRPLFQISSVLDLIIDALHRPRLVADIPESTMRKRRAQHPRQKFTARLDSFKRLLLLSAPRNRPSSSILLVRTRLRTSSRLRFLRSLITPSLIFQISLVRESTRSSTTGLCHITRLYVDFNSRST